MEPPSPLPPLETRPLFRPLLSALLELLRGLSPEEWENRASRAWSVRDVVAHLVDGDARQLSFGRDALPLLPPDRPIQGPDDFLAFLDGLNADWVKAAKRASPRLLADFVELTGRQVAEHFESLDPEGEAIFAVAWAGEERSRNWMHVARELTERLHHQQQIRRATGRPLLADPAIVGAAIEAFLYGLPPAYAATAVPDGIAVEILVTEPVGRRYALVRDGGRWRLSAGVAAPAASIALDPESAWLALTRSIPRAEALRRAHVDGDAALAAPFFDACSIHKRPVED